ncbi:MAG: lysoplasmalogenase [Alphaproteobacteria bacterium]|nr:MAG: lysoplasmalogenase [Alphaproteobacteria bacterium]
MRPLVAILGASAAVAVLYPLLWSPGPASALEIAVKGTPVGLLALAAALRARSVDGWLLAAVMALGATGDVLLEVAFTAGAAAFALGHVVAIWLYLRNRREFSLIAVAILLFAVVTPSLLLPPGADRIGFTIYASLLGAMAAAAWLSRFPRARIGALLFLASDMLIAWRMGWAERPLWLGLAIWWLYYAGQLLIWLGVTGGGRSSASLTRSGGEGDHP